MSAQLQPSLRASWARCWTGLGAHGDGAEHLERLLAAYAESHRKYHTLQHLFECLSFFDRHRTLSQEPDEVELALWFHDAIYQVRAGDNEEQSARWAVEALREAGVVDARIARIHSHILATRHAVLPIGRDQQLLVDIDLSILGAAPERFDEYETQVRAEYRWVPEFLFKPKRREILAEFLARQPIFATPALRADLESRARDNLARSLQQLKGS